jgi:hypothetical protein
MIESLAYSLKQLAAKQDWQPELSDEWRLVRWGECCSYGGHLSAEFLAAMRRADTVDEHKGPGDAKQSVLRRLTNAVWGAAVAAATISG